MAESGRKKKYEMFITGVIKAADKQILFWKITNIFFSAPRSVHLRITVYWAPQSFMSRLISLYVDNKRKNCISGHLVRTDDFNFMVPTKHIVSGYCCQYRSSALHIQKVSHKHTIAHSALSTSSNIKQHRPSFWNIWSGWMDGYVWRKSTSTKQA